MTTNLLRGTLIMLTVTLKVSQAVVDQVECKGRKVDLVFLLDSSGSINETSSADGKYRNWELSLNFLKSMVDQMENVGLWRVGMVVFGNQAHNRFFLNSYTTNADIKTAINGTRFLSQNTNTSGAIRKARTEQFVRHRGDRDDVTNVIIIVSDGNPTYDKEQTIPQARQAQEEGILIFCVGVTTKIDETYLGNMSSPPHEEGTNWFRTADFDALDGIVEKLAQSTCVVTSSVDRPVCPVCITTTDSGIYKIMAIVSSIVAGTALIGLMSCACMSCHFYNKFKALEKKTDL